MKLLKVGRSPECDIIINNEFVGSHHADITILDSGEIIIEDKGSKNGTFVGPDRRKLKPGEEVQVRRGDLVKFADSDLVWANVPQAPRNSHYKKVLNIGSNYRNDIVVNDSTVSRYHAAVKVDPKNKVYIIDNKSTNGTEVNGVRIKPNQETRIKKGDIVVVGNQDITSQLSPLFPKRTWLAVAAGFVGVAIIVLAAIWIIRNVLPSSTPKDAVAHVTHEYHYIISPKNNPYDLPLTFEETEDNHTTIQGTAFFIDDEGRLATCLHVVEPWNEEFDPEKTKELKKDWADYLSRKLPKQVKTYDELEQLLSSPIGEYISAHATSLPQVNAILNTIFTSDLEIKGVTDELRIGYPGRMYNKITELDPVSVYAKSKDPEADVAIIQLNTKVTPEKSGKVKFDLNKSYAHFPKPMQETFYTIGYPSGIMRAIDQSTLSLEPYIRESKVAKNPSKYFFELQDMSTGGASGSPVFNDNNSLAGIVSASWKGGAPTVQVIHARYLKDLYDQNVNFMK